ncbi:WD domain G-beta repeat family protein [Brugia pahangi]
MIPQHLEENLLYRELHLRPINFQRNALGIRNFLDRLGHSKTLKGHEGCVNCLQWNASGSLLASGSDDMQIRLWNVEGKSLHCIKSGHMNNIFSVQFLPSGSDDLLISAAGDANVRMHSISRSDVPYVWWSGGRVKRLAITRADPYLFWSAAEDGFIKQYDVRTAKATSLIEFDQKECKSLAINENRPEMIAVALNEAPVPLYDRRNVSKPLFTVIPGHIPISDSSSRHPFRTLSVTHVGFNSLGNELIVNIGGEQIYIFNVLDRAHEPDALQSLNSFIDDPVRNLLSTGGFPGFDKTTTEVFRGERELAKIHFNNEEYTDAINTYSQTILDCEKLCGHDPPRGHPHSMDLCLLLANRGASYLRRLWDGDAYAALLDLIRALKIEPRNSKVHYRITRALIELKQYDMARKISKLFKERFPDDHSCDRLDAVLQTDPTGQKIWTSNGCSDYVQRLCGHCNTNTDIKEAVWFGGRDEYIAAGSDCGSLLIWERKSGALIKGFEADMNILNCVQPHPSILLLATSGIEHVIRFWEPLHEDFKRDSREAGRELHRLTALSAANQKRMHTGIFDMVVASMGLAVQGGDDDDVERGRRVGCNAS